MKGAMTTRLLWFVASFLFLVPFHIYPQGVAIIEIENVQLARSLAAVVRDSAGSPMAGVLVEELSSDWKEPVRSTKTDAAGRFKFAPVNGRDVYYFQLTLKGFNPLRVRVKVDQPRKRTTAANGTQYLATTGYLFHRFWQRLPVGTVGKSLLVK